MKWRKLGQVFDPAHHALPEGCTRFAQGPQALVFDDFVRIYFSTRRIEERSGLPTSHVAFVDLGRDLRTVLRVSDRSVIPLGETGCFDEHGIFPMNVLRHEGRIYGYTCGWSRRVSVSVDTAIGLAFSDDDGLSFHKVGAGPVLAASLHEPFLIADPCVQRHGGRFHMWYIFGTAWRPHGPDGTPERVYKIGHAVSQDGVHWERESGKAIVADRLGADECQAMPTVVRLEDGYHMLFCYRQATDFRTDRDRSYRIGHAFSGDLVHWVRADEASDIVVSEQGWDAEMICYPHVFQWHGDVFLLYNGNAFGRHGFGAAILE
ncbi:MAG: hypothetical protein OEL88_05015 [Sterolibacteriaceae bacterium MAG5]|nr:hypothetical protein [Candidatus Nitricoxidireducens bremensis]